MTHCQFAQSTVRAPSQLWRGAQSIANILSRWAFTTVVTLTPNFVVQSNPLGSFDLILYRDRHRTGAGCRPCHSDFRQGRYRISLFIDKDVQCASFQPESVRGAEAASGE